METIARLIGQRQRALRQSALCTYLGDAAVPAYQRLSFVPAMMFFTMGFKDILAVLRDPDDASPLQRSVNLHCDEDAFHWEWYLQDLERIEHGARLLGVPAVQAFADVWSPANHATRDTVYHAIFLAKSHRTPFLRMVIIEALEATFACFNEPMFRLVGELGMAERLRYFGNTHKHAEDSHAKDQGEPACLDAEAGDGELAAAALLVNELFEVFGRMFECWYAARLDQRLLARAA